MAYDGPGGALFKNNRKERDTHPDLTGFVELTEELVRAINDQAADGVKYPKIEISGWSKVSGKGNKFISLSAKKPWEKTESRGGSGSRGGQDQGRAYSDRNTRSNDIDDDIPF